MYVIITTFQSVFDYFQSFDHLEAFKMYWLYIPEIEIKETVIQNGFSVYLCLFIDGKVKMYDSLIEENILE